ncbi:ABC transporter ATP-binding protein [Clostridium sp. KNHs214]|uniref:ABC transporter ATP-binding protein n=1 Tax=Clostridium sp. KNHs214 TaxID=1540257 RepID=UPI000559345D|nr:ABC transporter ATP-binding protein [Clostridium sp. KNHs214]
MFLQLKNLVKSFKDLKVVNDLNMDIEKGEMVCLLGSSGCGKTTTLRMIGGFLKPDGGNIILDGNNITNLESQERPVSTVFQSYALFPNMNVIQNVIYGLKFQGYKKKEALRIGEEYLHLVGLDDYKNSSVSKLSGGQQQRVALARALVLKPKILLLDEPLSNLDAKLRLKMRDEIKDINERFKITMIFVTHDQEEALSISDKIAVMNEGKIEQIGTPEDLYNNPKTDFVANFIGTLNRLKLQEGSIKFIRPEKIIIHSDKGQQNAEIIKKQFLGPNSIYSIKTSDGQVLKVQVINTLDNFNVGDKVNYTIV